jgi:hypothetical protein
VSFAYDRNKDAIFDPETGEILRQERAHWQEPRWVQTIIGPDGSARFRAIILTDADGALANPRRKGDHVLTSAVRFHADGVGSEVSRKDPDLRRVVAYLRDQSHPSTPFHLTDKRSRRETARYKPVDPRFALVLAALGLAVAVGMKLANAELL